MNWPDYIFSEKEITDFKRREEVAKKLKVGIPWKNIKKTTGAHFQTITTISKRLKSKKSNPSGTKLGRSNIASAGDRPVFVFGRAE